MGKCNICGEAKDCRTVLAIGGIIIYLCQHCSENVLVFLASTSRDLLMKAKLEGLFHGLHKHT